MAAMRLVQQPTAQSLIYMPTDTPTRLRFSSRHRHPPGPHPAAAGAAIPKPPAQFSWILSALSISAKMIAAHVRRARLDDVLGTVGNQNVQGEQQQKLDVIANDILLRTLGGREGVAIVASEENEEPVILRADDAAERKYCVLFDPLDGSSNLDVCGAVGTIFSILRKDRRSAAARRPRSCSRGSEQVAAGYVLYGSSTVFVLTIGLGRRHVRARSGYGAFMRVAQGVQIPKRQQVLLGQRRQSPELPRGLSDSTCPGRRSAATRAAMSARWSPTCIASCLQGGVFMYPPTKKAPQGQAAADVRSQSDGHARGAGRRQGAERARSSASSMCSRPTFISACRSSSAAARKSIR